MEDLRQLSVWIRDYGHDPRHMQGLLSARLDWHQLWTALDIIDDVDLALTAYLHADFPSSPGEKYLRVYGVFQALFVQQDALQHLVEIVRPAINISVPDLLKEVREARNASVGHPTKLKRKGEVSTHGISQITMTKEGFDLVSFTEKNGISFQNIRVCELIKKQRAEVVQVLSRVVNELKQEDNKHKMLHRSRKLRESFDQVGYALEKIHEELRGNSEAAVLGKWGADHLQASLDGFESMLRERGLGIDTYDSVRFLYDEIAFPLTELRRFLGREDSVIPSAKAAVVFAYALRGWFGELKEIAEEIDRDYATQE